jgi:hypothetical protein
MQRINLHDLKNYTAGLIAELLSQQNDNAFEIIIPREPLDPDDKDFSIFWQYHMAAYAGQQLYNVAESFAYDVLCPKKLTAFRFEIEVSETERLAAALAFICCGYFDNDEAMLKFNQDAADYLSNSFEGTISCATWGLLSIANDHLGK